MHGSKLCAEQCILQWTVRRRRGRREEGEGEATSIEFSLTVQVKLETVLPSDY